jgi:hypothetical protein
VPIAAGAGGSTPEECWRGLQGEILARLGEVRVGAVNSQVTLVPRYRGESSRGPCRARDLGHLAWFGRRAARVDLPRGGRFCHIADSYVIGMIAQLKDSLDGDFHAETVVGH